MMQHDEIRDLVAAYALGAVEPGEKRDIESHVATCDECRRQLAMYEATTDAMARAVEPVPLPAGFVDRVVTTAVVDRESEVGRSRRWTRLAIAMTAAIVAACVVVAGTVLESRSDSERRRRVLAILQSGEGIALTGGDVSARIVPTDDGSRFAIAGPDGAPENRTYQLWLMRGENCPSPEASECEVVSAGTFDTEDRTGLLELGENIEEWEDAAVTVEPLAGSEFPTTTPFADSL